jgi:tetratricopeptide (TPR) repeat protein
MKTGRLLAVLSVLGSCLAAGQSTDRTPSVLRLLDRYADGAFDLVVRDLSGDVDFNDLLEQLRRDGPAWIAAGGDAERDRRELTAATFALEAARVDAWREWKWIQKQPQMCSDDGWCYQPPSVLYGKPPPLLIEWGCALLRQRETPRPIERWWQLAAVSVAQRAEDPQFLVGDPNIGRGLGTEEIGNTKDEIKHLEHLTLRFPLENRFLLAQGIARDRVWPEDAEQVYRALQSDPDIAGEAAMRFGAMRLRQRQIADALDLFNRAEMLTRDPYVIFLARYFKGQALERDGRADRAEAAYRGAVATIPHAQSATVALAALAFRNDRRAEAQDLVARMLGADPPPVDPWREFVHADDRFWPLLIARLRAEIRP